MNLHLNTKGRFARLPVAMRGGGFRTGIGVDENTAIVVQDRRLQVLGHSGLANYLAGNLRLDITPVRIKQPIIEP